MSGDKLTACPFCGGKAERITIGDDEPNNAGGDVIVCTRCQASSHVEFGRKENLVDHWNARTNTTTELVGALKDPNAVHLNMLRGGIAKPSLAQIIHIYGRDAIEAALHDRGEKE